VEKTLTVTLNLQTGTPQRFTFTLGPAQPNEIRTEPEVLKAGSSVIGAGHSEIFPLSKP